MDYETTNQSMQKPFHLSRRKVLTHVSLVRMTTLTAVCSMGCLAGGFISIILGTNLITSLAAAGAVSLFLVAMMWVDEIAALLMYLLSFILWVGLGMRYVSMTQRQVCGRSSPYVLSLHLSTRFSSPFAL